MLTLLFVLFQKKGLNFLAGRVALSFGSFLNADGGGGGGGIPSNPADGGGGGAVGNEPDRVGGGGGGVGGGGGGGGGRSIAVDSDIAETGSAEMELCSLNDGRGGDNEESVNGGNFLFLTGGGGGGDLVFLNSCSVFGLASRRASSSEISLLRATI